MGHAPWHMWLVAPVALGFGGARAWDYLSTHGGGGGILTGVTYVQIVSAGQGLPGWVAAAWAVGVWLGVIGALLLLLKSRFASTAFALSLTGTFVTALGCAVLTVVPMAQLFGSGRLLITLGIPIVTFLLWRYARRMTRAGHLR
ncbi:hypothetical protein [Aliiroseovarius subalbicans]|uniref:hypothetical protein n=1 Tax=Aliiroseovarius subalbicans TaxID=2925840 RepID=UPI001F580E84|nr:hypothetical protein [Aliiroseovarius subalbicans]MCI2400396.1 hypothetical protein [Aliiroseovarius subalbicans]